jgi:hypothetical protein
MQIKVWDEFVMLLQRGALADDRIRPYHASMQESLSRHLQAICDKTDWREWQVSPETHQVGEQVHFLLPLNFDGQRKTFCFSFLVDEGQWYWQHVESIFIRLDRLGPLPAMSFPDLPERQKAWMREELRVTEQVRLFKYLSENKGAPFLPLTGSGMAQAMRSRPGSGSRLLHLRGPLSCTLAGSKRTCVEAASS